MCWYCPFINLLNSQRVFPARGLGKEKAVPRSSTESLKKTLSNIWAWAEANSSSGMDVWELLGKPWSNSWTHRQGFDSCWKYKSHGPESTRATFNAWILSTGRIIPKWVLWFSTGIPIGKAGNILFKISLNDAAVQWARSWLAAEYSFWKLWRRQKLPSKSFSL